MKKSLIVIAAATLIPLGAAVAGEGKDQSAAGGMFDTLDANRDGRISQAEAASDTTIMFSSADRNGDGYLDKTEWRAHQKGGTSNQPQPQSMPESTSPDSSATDSTVPEPSASEPRPDTETPRQ